MPGKVVTVTNADSAGVRTPDFTSTHTSTFNSLSLTVYLTLTNPISTVPPSQWIIWCMHGGGEDPVS